MGWDWADLERGFKKLKKSKVANRIARLAINIAAQAHGIPLSEIRFNRWKSNPLAAATAVGKIDWNEVSLKGTSGSSQIGKLKHTYKALKTSRKIIHRLNWRKS